MEIRDHTELLKRLPLLFSFLTRSFLDSHAREMKITGRYIEPHFSIFSAKYVCEYMWKKYVIPYCK